MILEKPDIVNKTFAISFLNLCSVMKILHIINSLNKGGAEGNLFRLCKFHKQKYKKKIDITIFTLISEGHYNTELQKLGINILSLDINKHIKLSHFIKKIFFLRKLVRKYNPNVIQSWMYHSNFMTLFLPINFFNRLLWNIRHSELNIKISKKKTIMISLICGVFSKFIPSKIIYCSQKSINFHEKKHLYSKTKLDLYTTDLVIRNIFHQKN